MGYNGSTRVVFGRILSGSKGVVVFVWLWHFGADSKGRIALVSVHLILGYSSPFPIQSRTKGISNHLILFIGFALIIRL